MYQKSPYRPENSAYVQLLYLFLLAIVGLIVFIMIGFGAVLLTDGVEGLKAAALGDKQYVGSLKILVVAQQLGLFLVPAILLPIIERRKINGFYGLKAPQINWLLVVAVLSVCWMPLMSLVNEWNQEMALPKFLSGIEKWMKDKEQEAALLTEQLLAGKSIKSLLVNLVVIAITPAICEEFLFRGAMQRIIFRLKSNPHMAIWLSAIIFSTIHFQFYGFLPRLLLGAAFGYVYFWTGSIWYAVFAHFLNNGYAVFVAYYLQLNNQSYTKAEDISMPWYGYLISAILTLALFKFLKDKNSKHRELA